MIDLNIIRSRVLFALFKRSLRLNKKVAHFIEQCAKNSLFSFQPECLKRTRVCTSSILSEKVISVPTHSSTPSFVAFQ